MTDEGVNAPVGSVRCSCGATVPRVGSVIGSLRILVAVLTRPVVFGRVAL
jgi:hypothetical protein